jgi:methylated-DNA-[protein]-cysteine S-methyltransferase
MNLHLTLMDSPIGPLALIADDGTLVGVDLHGHHGEDSGVVRHLARHLERTHGALTFTPHPDAAGAAGRLRAYFAGDLGVLAQQSVRTYGTGFQCEIWNALTTIPAGTTWTYAQLAHAIGRPQAVRAAGAANGANPVSLFVPCHRVIGADGTLWGYGGGLDRKAWLLNHEKAVYRAMGTNHASQLGLHLAAL